MGWQVPIQPVAYTPEIATDTTSRSASTTSFVQVSGDFDVPANDAETGSVYKMTLWGTVTYTTSSATPQLEVELFGTTVVTVTLSTSATGTFTFSLYGDVWVIVTLAGASGTVSGAMNMQGATASGVVQLSGFGTFSGVSVNTTADSGFFVNGRFSPAGGTPSLTIDASVYERDGPGAAPLL